MKDFEEFSNLIDWNKVDEAVRQSYSNKSAESLVEKLPILIRSTSLELLRQYHEWLNKLP